MALALSLFRISGRLCVKRFPRGMLPSASRQQGTTVPSQRIPTWSRRPIQKCTSCLSAALSGQMNFSAASRYILSESVNPFLFSRKVKLFFSTAIISSLRVFSPPSFHSLKTQIVPFFSALRQKEIIGSRYSSRDIFLSLASYE